MTRSVDSRPGETPWTREFVEGLLEESDRFRRLQSVSPSVIYELRLEGGAFVPVWVSSNIKRIFGYSPEEVTTPAFWAEHAHPEDAHLTSEGPARLLRDGRAEATYRFRRAGGEYRWLHDELSLLRDSNGDPERIIGSWSDITERRNVEDALRASEERFRLSFENAPVGMAVVGLDERFLHVNSALCEILGRTPEELLGMTVPQVTCPEDVDAEHAQKARILHGESAGFRMPKRYLHADGHVVWGHLSVSAITDPEGRPLYYIGQLEDITERMKAEATLIESEERLRALVEKSTDVIAVLNPKGVPGFANNALAEALGRPLAEIRSSEIFAYLHPGDVAAAREIFNRILRQPGSSGRLTLRVIRPDESVRVFDTTGTSLLHLTSVGGVVINARDVTEQKSMEAQVQQAQRLESVGRLAGGIAHDFNNLLTTIFGYTELLETGAVRSEEDRVALTEIRRAAQRAGDLTRRLLAFARRQVIAPRVLDLNDVVRNAEGMLERVLGEDIQLDVRFGDTVSAVKAEPSQLEQVILNLALNARDAMPEGGCLAIETANVDIDDASFAVDHGVQPGHWVRLRVEDTGIGMSREVLAHVFEPFFTTKSDGKGNGFGLATVYGIVKQGEGSISVESEPGRGTAFTIYLPRSAEAPAQVPERSPTARGGTELILLVEDDTSVRDLIAELLTTAGHEVLVAVDGSDALKKVRASARPPALLLTDVVMPGMSGKEVASALTAQNPSLRVLFMSGYAEDMIAHRGVLESGINFLGKPFTTAELLDQVRRALDAR